MSTDKKRADIQSILRDACHVAGWNPDTQLRVLCNYLNSQGNLEALTKHINEIVLAESGERLYDDLPPTETRETLGVLTLIRDEDTVDKVFVLDPAAKACWIEARGAAVYIFCSAEGILVEVLPRDCPDKESLGAISFPWHELTPEGTQVVTVRAVAKTDLLHPLDKEVVGDYRVAVPENVNAQQAAAIALDVFYSQVPIKVLDDFLFSVIDETGDTIPEANDHESYSGKSQGYVIRKF